MASAFDSDDLSDVAKVIVMCSFLGQYIKYAEEKRATFQYDLFTKVIDSGLGAAEQIDSTNNATNDKVILDTIWDRMIATVSSLLAGHPEIDLDYLHSINGNEFRLDTRELRCELDDMSLSDPRIVLQLESAIRDHLKAMEKNGTSQPIEGE